MVKLKKYQQIIEDLLREIYNYDSSQNSNGIESEIIIDRENNHYLLVDVGWNNEQEYVYGTFFI